MKHISETLKQIEVDKINDNVFNAIGKDWMLITAGTPEKFNTMTASWGTLGILWNKPVAICFIRPTRYTYEFSESNEYFTLSFFTDAERSILSYCGSKSGRNVDKIKETGLLPLVTPHNSVCFEQARLVLECRKIYYDDLKPGNFLLPEIDAKFFPQKDYHRIYIGEITNSYCR